MQQENEKKFRNFSALRLNDSKRLHIRQFL